MPRFFTHAQAEALLPRLRPLIDRALRCKAALAWSEGQFRQLKLRVAQSGGSFLNLKSLTALQDQRQASADGLQQAMAEIQETGCLVKDLDAGLLDFPTLYNQREVYLCWRADEAGIRFWHGVDEGLAGRHEIDADFLARHRGDAAQ